MAVSRLTTAAILLMASAPCHPARAAGKSPHTALQLLGRGDQVYVCAAKDGGFAWSLRGPDAVLFDRSGARVGTHFAGPSWRWDADGGTIAGDVVASAAAPRAGSVAWLVIAVRPHPPGGVFGGVTTVTRTDTQGGSAPATGCDTLHVGTIVRVPYSATYTVF